MAYEQEIKINVDKSDADKSYKELAQAMKDAEKEVENLSKAMDGLGDDSEEAGKKATDSLDDLDKGAKESKKSVSGVSTAFNGLGTAMKAAGIGFIISAVAFLGKAFSENQRVIDVFSEAMETIQIVFSEVATAVLNTYDSVTKSAEGFDALGKVLKGIMTVTLTPLKLAFYGIKLGIQELQLVWEDSFLGGGDQDKIIELRKGITETTEQITQIGVNAIEAGKSIVNNFKEAGSELVNISKIATEEFEKIDIKDAQRRAKRNVELKKNAELAAVAQQGLIEKYNVQAEKLRQLRDSDLNSIGDRIQANENLKEVLDKQEKSMIRNADLVIASAQADLEKNNNLENQVALQQALNEKQAVTAQIEGFRSEQLANVSALKKEELDLTNSLAQVDTDRHLDAMRFNAEIIEDDFLRYEALLEVNALEKKEREKQLKDKIKNYKKGTQARQDAEAELTDFTQANEQERLSIEKDAADKKKEYDLAVSTAKVNSAMSVSSLVSQIAGKDSVVAKGVAVASATIAGYESVQNTFKTASASPITVLNPAYPFIQAGIAGTFSALQIANILKSDPTGQSTTAPASVSAPAPAQVSAPSFNLVQGTQSNQIAQSLLGSQSKPVEAFVVSSNVSSGQELDRKIIKSASL